MVVYPEEEKERVGVRAVVDEVKGSLRGVRSFGSVVRCWSFWMRGWKIPMQ